VGKTYIAVRHRKSKLAPLPGPGDLDRGLYYVTSFPKLIPNVLSGILGNAMAVMAEEIV
jgi:hypothetical protein